MLVKIHWKPGTDMVVRYITLYSILEAKNTSGDFLRADVSYGIRLSAGYSLSRRSRRNTASRLACFPGGVGVLPYIAMWVCLTVKSTVFRQLSPR